MIQSIIFFILFYLGGVKEPCDPVINIFHVVLFRRCEGAM